jgi:hypothetical protein
MMVDGGLEWMVDRCAGTSNDVTSVGVGTGTTAPVETDTALETEVMPAGGGTRNAATGSDSTTKTRRYTMNMTTAQGNGSTFTEVGLFLAASAGGMITRTVHSGYSKTVAISVKYQVDITFARS